MVVHPSVLSAGETPENTLCNQERLGREKVSPHARASVNASFGLFVCGHTSDKERPIDRLGTLHGTVPDAYKDLLRLFHRP